MRTRELHGHIRRQITRVLNGRSWKWLAEASGIPQSTLHDQARARKFSLDVLVRIAATLDRSPLYFLPPEALVEPDPRRVEELIRSLRAALDAYEEGQGP